MNIANQLTILRIILAIVCIVLLLNESLLLIILALVAFIGAALTDAFDGYFARKRQEITDLGKILDPVADKTLTLGVFITFAFLSIISIWPVILIVIREVTITGLRLYWLNKKVVLSAKSLGKIKAVSQFITIIFIFVVYFFVVQCGMCPLSAYFVYTIIPIVMWYVVFITVFSGLFYLWINRSSDRTLRRETRET